MGLDNHDKLTLVGDSGQVLFSITNVNVTQSVEDKDEYIGTGELASLKEVILFYLWRIQQSPDEAADIKKSAAKSFEIVSALVEKLWVEKGHGATAQTFRWDLDFKDILAEMPPLAEGETPREEDMAKLKAYSELGHKTIRDTLYSEPVKGILALYLKINTKAEKKTRNRKKAEPKDKGPHKVSGHLIDQKLKYFRPEPGGALKLFEALQEETQNKIKDKIKGVEVNTVVEGVRLSPTENKVIDSLCKLLHQKSEVFDEKAANYYSGNLEAKLAPYGIDKDGQKTTEVAPQLAFTLYELTKEFKGGESPSGKDIANVGTILQELESKRFLISYTAKSYKKDGGRTERKIEEFQPLIRLLKYSESDYTNTNDLTKRTEEIIVSLNPIFRHQINSKFILYPYDLNRRTIIAYGSHNISDAAYRLRDYLMREKSYSHTKCEINVENLYWLLCEKWMKEKRRKKVTEYVDAAIQMSRRLGLLEKYETMTGADGQLKAVFHINSKWQ